MAEPPGKLGAGLKELHEAASTLDHPLQPGLREALRRVLNDLAATIRHIERDPSQPPVVVVLGGTGTGKSTLVNRLLEGELSATSFRRTFTAGVLAITNRADSLEPGWLGVRHVTLKADQLPTRGQSDELCIVLLDKPLTQQLSLVDTPDLDGDQPAHHVQADRAFRWADALVFLVTPEKYQMTELLPYYRLAGRYGVAAVYVMNKTDAPDVLDDYRRLLVEHAERSPRVFAVPRDDSAWQAPAEMSLDALRNALPQVAGQRPQGTGMVRRSLDVLERFRDQVLDALARDADAVARLHAALTLLSRPEPGVDVSPMTQQLQRRLQQRSVLYLMGPRRMLDRVRQVPMFLSRLPRITWDLLRSGKARLATSDDLPPELTPQQIDFGAALAEQLTIVQSRLDDLLRADPVAGRWIDSDPHRYAAVRIPVEQASAIANEELHDLQQWLEKRWNATPRDTAIVQKLVRHLPGGEKLTGWSEAAPYLLAAVVATQNAFFGPIDLLVIGGFSLATWIGEKLSNEVASRVRQTNRRIAIRFDALCVRQIELVGRFVQSQSLPRPTLRRLESLVDSLAQLCGEGKS
jgi:GTPase SAR1 family protein